MNQEIEFARKIEEIKELAASQGSVVSKAQVEEAFGSIGMSGDMLAPVYEYLKTKKIGVDEKINPDEFLTEEETNYLDTYLESLEELHTYTDGEKRAVYMSAMAGDSRAKEQLIEIMLPDVVDMAKLYAGQGMLIEDLIGEGNVALATAVEMLAALEEPDEVPVTLAKMIMNAMEEAIGEEIDSKKTDEKIADKVNRVAKEAEELAIALGRKVTVDELAAEGKLSKKAILEAVRLSGNKIEDIDNKE